MKVRIAVLLIFLASALPSFAAPPQGALLVSVDDPGAPPIALESDIESLELRTDPITLAGGLGITLKGEASDRMSAVFSPRSCNAKSALALRRAISSQMGCPDGASAA